MPEKIEGIDLQASIHCRWRNVAPDRKHFTASDVRDLVDLTRYHLPDNRELDNIPMSEKSDKELRSASVHFIGMLVANGDTEDLVWAWVWIAAAMGEQFAGLALAGRLLREASDIGCRDRSRYRRLARAAAFPNCFGNTALEDLIDSKSLDNWLLKISAPDVYRPMVQSGIASPRLTTTDRHGCIKLIQSAGGLSVGRRAEDQKALDGLEILRTGVTVVNMPKNLESIRQVLALEFPWAEDVTNAIFDDLFLSAASGSPELHLAPTILVGPPASGKTSYVKLLSSHLQLPCAILSAAGSADNRFLTGTARGWSSAAPCFPAEFMAKTAAANPIIFIDEIEKASFDSRNGRLQDTLLVMMEPTSAGSYLDEFIGLPVDLSHINWIAGANSLNGISPALQSRFRVISFRVPEEHHFECILERSKCRIASTLGIRPEDLPAIDPIVMKALFRLFRSTSDMRRMQRALRAVYAKCPRRAIGVYH